MSEEKKILPLWNHQKQGLYHALQQQNFAFFMDLGTGKTGTLINVLRHQYAKVGSLRKTLIISPLITLGNWRNEFDKFSRVQASDITVLRGTGANKAKQFLNAVMDPLTKTLSRNRVIITNYEAMQNKDLHKYLMFWEPEIVVLDEAHRARNYKGKRSQAICKIADRAQHRYLLTGTPILNNSQDVFYLYRILDGGQTFGENFFAFRSHYFQDKNAGFQGRPQYFPDWQERTELRGEITKKMYFDSEGKPKAHRVLKKDCIDLPPLVRQAITFEISIEQRKMYDEMKREFLTYVEELKNKGEPLAVVANLAVTKALRLQQIASGFVRAEDGQDYPIKDNPRLEALRELLEDTTASGKVIVWTCWKQNYRDVAIVCKDLKLEYRMLTGDVSAAQKELAMVAFRTNPNIRVMIANQAAAGVGVNLVEAPVSIFYSRNFSLEQDLQAEARNYRGGSHIHEKVTRIDLIAKDTIDELVAEVLTGKQSVANSILDLAGRL